MRRFSQRGPRRADILVCQFERLSSRSIRGLARWFSALESAGTGRLESLPYAGRRFH